MSVISPTLLYGQRVLPDPGAGISFAEFNMRKNGYGVKIIIDLTTAAVLSLRSIEASGITTDYSTEIADGVLLAASRYHVIKVDSLLRYKPGTDLPGIPGILINYSLRVSVGGIIRHVMIDEIKVDGF